MTHINRVYLLGNMGDEPKFIGNELSGFYTFSVATTESWRDKVTGNIEKSTSWHNVLCGKHLVRYVEACHPKKGCKVAIEGKLKYSKREEDGRIFCNIIADTVDFTSKKSDEQSDDKPADDYTQKRKPPIYDPNGDESKKATALDFDDDIPF